MMDKFDHNPMYQTIAALPQWERWVSASSSIREVAYILDSQVTLPGVLILDQKRLIGLLPRDVVYEKLGRPFGVELFMKLTCQAFYSMFNLTTLVLDKETPISEAVNQALRRDPKNRYDPIVIDHGGNYLIASMYDLLMAQQAVIQNLYEEVQKLSTKDPLTMINNRRGFFEAVNEYWLKIDQPTLDFAILMIDIDQFKNINDRYGHMVGDKVVKALAERIRLHLRKQDIIARFGGDEFVVFLPQAAPFEATSIAERIRQEIASAFHFVHGFQVRATVSIGLNHASGSLALLDRILLEADQALYMAKYFGRNRVVSWEEKHKYYYGKRRTFRTKEIEAVNQSERSMQPILNGLLRMLYLRDYETEAHTSRVSEMTVALARLIGVDSVYLEAIRLGALLHDIGKIAIPDRILFKKSKLNDEEWAIMKKHPEHAYDLLLSLGVDSAIVEIPYLHHEQWNGKGYPRGLMGDQIPLSARLFSLVDVWDALISDRPYRSSMKAEDAKQYILQQAGVVFDPQLVPVFLNYIESVRGVKTPADYRRSVAKSNHDQSEHSFLPSQ